VDVSDIVKWLATNANIEQREQGLTQTLGQKRDALTQTIGQRREVEQGREGRFQQEYGQKERFQEKYKLTAAEQKEIAMARIAAARAAAIPGLGLRNDAANARDVGRMETSIKNYFQVADAKGQLKNMNALHAAHANINVTGDNTAIAHRDALVQLARFFRGSIPTEGEMKLLYDKIGGVFGTIDTFEKGLINGDISDQMIANLKESTKIALAESEQRRGQMFSGLAKIIGPTGAYGTMGPQANAMAKGYGQLFGVEDMPDVIEVAPGYTGTVLGTGLRPGQEPAPRKKGKGKAAPAAAAPAGKVKSKEDYLKAGGF
jgi:hypothetical protein